MRKIQRAVTALALATGAVTTVGMVNTEAASAAPTVHGCPSGWACVYPQNAGWNGDRPSLKWYKYGTYRLYNQYGNHYIYNNQTGGAPFWLCTDSNGRTCPSYVGAGAWAPVNLTPINSVKLVPSL